MKNTQKAKSKVNFSSRIFLMLLFCFSSVAFMQAQKVVTGVVVDEKREPLVGVNVLIKGQGTAGGTTTDFDGKYKIKVDGDNVVLDFSIVGFANQEAAVGDRTVIDVILGEDTKVLEEVVVIGFQSQKKSDLTAAVSSVGKEVFENRPVSSIGQALKGALPGVNIRIPGGSPNAIPSINLRGATSVVLKQDGNSSKPGDYEISNGTPLILVDGVEINSTQMNQLNPNDIENTSFLKDASAAAIYGTRATFGVVIITTKSGSFDQKAQISYSYSVGWDKAAAVPDILNSYNIQRASLDKDLWTIRKIDPDGERQAIAMQAYIDNPIFANSFYQDGASVKWVGNMNPFDVALKSWTPTQKHNASVSGGSKNVSYHVSLGMLDKEGLYKVQADQYKRYNAASTINAKVTSWMNLTAKVSLSQTKYYTPEIGTTGKGTLWNAMVSGGAEVARNINMPLQTGTQAEIDAINLAREAEGLAPLSIIPNYPTDNILSLFKNSTAYSRDKRNTSIYSVAPEFIIIPKELRAKIEFSYVTSIYEKLSVEPKFERYDVGASWNPIATHTETNNASETRHNDNRYNLNAYLEYNKKIMGHNLTALVGYNQELNTRKRLIGNYKQLFAPNIIDPSAVEDKSLNTITNYFRRTSARAVFGRILYDYKSRYLFEFDVRYDGSSKFPKSNRFQTFPTFSMAWRPTEEKFMEFSREYVDNIKLRFSWGELGSQPDDYAYIARMNSGVAGYLFEGGRFPQTVRPGDLVNPNLTWERARTINYGLDITALKNRLDMTLEMYDRRTTDILMAPTSSFPNTLGTGAPLENTGSIESKGWELMLKWRDKLPNGIKYGVGFSLQDGKTTVRSFKPNASYALKDLLYTGQRIGEIWGYETGGILQESDFDGFSETNNKWVWNGTDHTAITQNLAPGYVWLKDLDGNGIISDGVDNTLYDHGDTRVIGNNLARYNYSINLDAEYKGFDVSLHFQGTGKRDYWLGATSYWGGAMGSKYMYNRSWTPERTNAKYPMYNTGGGAGSTRPHTAYLIDASYFKLQQVLLGYTVPTSLSRKISMERLRFTVSAYNIFTISDIPSHYDPEQLSMNYPQLRTIEVGVQVQF